MVNRQQQFTDEGESCSSERLQQLSKFQISILKHALSFPHVKKVVYSTCSIHDEENEQVVEEVYSQCCNKFDVENIMPGWRYRGKEKYEHGACCLRMSYEECHTNGFFVASFVRINTKSSENCKSETRNKMEGLCNNEDDVLYSRTNGSDVGKKKLKKSKQKFNVNDACRTNRENKCFNMRQTSKMIKATTAWTVINQSA